MDRPGVLPVSDVLFLFQYQPKGDPAKRSAFGKEEGASGYGVFAAPAETEGSWLLLTRWRYGLHFRFCTALFFSWKIETVLFFLEEKEKNGFKNSPSLRGAQTAPSW